MEGRASDVANNLSALLLLEPVPLTNWVLCLALFIENFKKYWQVSESRRCLARPTPGFPFPCGLAGERFLQESCSCWLPPLDSRAGVSVRIS